MSRRTPAFLATAAAAGAIGAGATTSSDTASAGRADQQTTHLVSRALGGGLPNGPSTHAVISGDKRYSRLIAFESEASNLVARDSNGQKDVFAIKRSGSINNKGTPWRGGRTILVSRGVGGPANGPSYGASVSGAFRKPGKCVAFMSRASNLVAGDGNGKVDAFLAKAPGRKVSLVSVGNGEDVTGVSVSGDCSRVSYTTASGALYTRKGRKKVKKVAGVTGAADPSYAQGASNALVVGGSGGVYLSSGGTGRAKLVAAGGRNPAFNDLKRRTLAYEKSSGGRTQIAYKDLGRGEKIISSRSGDMGNGDSRDPVIGNSGYYVTFESHASNLGVNALGRTGDANGKPDTYLFTDVRDITLVQSVERKAEPVPGGGENPSMSYYANYLLFDSPAPLGSNGGNRQIFMRYLGEV
jgi:hypothetical protein